MVTKMHVLGVLPLGILSQWVWVGPWNLHVNVTTGDPNASGPQTTLDKTSILDLEKFSLFHIKVTILPRIDFRVESNLF